MVVYREETAKASEADTVKARAALRQERLDWEKADAESRSALHSLRDEWRMLQDTNAQLHANVSRLTKALEVTAILPLHISVLAMCTINTLVNDSVAGLLHLRLQFLFDAFLGNTEGEHQHDNLKLTPRLSLGRHTPVQPLVSFHVLCCSARRCWMCRVPKGKWARG